MDTWIEEWDQQRAERRSIETMHRIALDAMELDDDSFYTYTAEHDLTVNEVVYYLNAYLEAALATVKDERAQGWEPEDVSRLRDGSGFDIRSLGLADE